MSIFFRSERIGDADAITRLVSRAFGAMTEADIIIQMREHPAFDPALSICGELDNELVAHAFFTLYSMRLLGETVPAAAVGPVAVHPDHQRRGYGQALLRAGNEACREAGAKLAVLYGHPTYYPRMGYRPCFGLGYADIHLERLPEPEHLLHVEPVTTDDVSWLAERWAVEWADVDFAWLWSAEMRCWRLPGMDCRLWVTAEGERAGWTANRAGVKRDVHLVAISPAHARSIIATFKPERLALHPDGRLAQDALDPVWSTPKADALNAAMALDLTDKAYVDRVLAARKAGRRPGTIPFPLEFRLN